MVIDTVLSLLLSLADLVFLLFDNIRETVSSLLGVNVTVEAWFSFWLFIALAGSTYVLSSRRGVVELVVVPSKVGSESVMAFRAERVAAESALKFLQDAFRKGEISEQLYVRLKSLYSDRLDRINEQLASLSKVEEIRGIEFELEEAKREFLERLKAPTIVEETKVERPMVKGEVVPKPVSREVMVPKVEAPRVRVVEETKGEVKPALPPTPPAPKGETLVQVLRDEMLKELRRLKEIIEKSS